MKQTKAAGAARERAVRQYFRQRGFVAIKVSDSAVCDVVALKRSPLAWQFAMKGVDYNTAHGDHGCLVLMVEVKANKTGGPYKHFCRPERDALLAAAERAGATPLLAHWPPGGELRLIDASEWPQGKDQPKEAAA